MTAMLAHAQTRAHISDDLSDLAEIYADNVNLCVVRRQPDPAVANFVTHLLQTKQTISLVERIQVNTCHFAELMPQLAHLPHAREFFADIARLATLFSDLFELSHIGLRLRTLDKAMCPKFHTDSVTCRLICTYGGSGTEWLAESAVNRAKLGMGSLGLSDEESGLLTQANAIQTIPAYAIGLLKGALWEGNEQHGAVHRSPKLSPESPFRLLLTMDFG